MDPSKTFKDKTNIIRRLRKKLRQIEKLERVERELSVEEERKVDSKDDIRSELQELVKEQEDSMVSLTKAKTEDEERAAVQDEVTSLEKLDAMNTFDTTNLNVDFEQVSVSWDKPLQSKFIDWFLYDGRIGRKGHHLGFAKPTSHLPQLNGHHLMNGEQFEGHSFNTHALNGHLDTHALNGHAVGGHHVPNHHNSPHQESHHLTGGSGGLSIGFSDDGEIVADLTETSNINGHQKVTLTESLLADDNKGKEINITKSSLRSKKSQKINNVNGKVDPLLLFQGLTFKMKLFEGHHHDTCAIDICGNYVISGSRDTSLKLWLATTQEELKSLGGHDATITGVKFTKDKSFSSYPNAVTSSYDCSLKVWNLEKGKIQRSVYVYSPVCCLDYSDGLACIGTEGGKVELYDIDTGRLKFSVRAHDDQVTAIKLLPDGKIASGSTDGILKIHDAVSKDQSEPCYVLDTAKLLVKQAVESEVDVTQIKSMLLTHSKITCIESYKHLIIYGDEGFNIKVLDYKKGEIVKIRNNLKEFSPTEALYVSRVQGCDFLFCVGSDVDNGDGFTNVRSLPDLRYMGTIRDSNVNSGPITSFCLEEVNNRIRFITGGAQLRTWDQIDPPIRRGKKRKSSNDDEEPYVPCKFVCTYTVPRESDPESESENESESQSSVGSDPVQRVEGQTPNSWCTLL